MCDATCSESGQLLTIKPCGWYLALKSDRDRLAGVVAGMEEQNARNIEALWRAEDANAELRRYGANLRVENARLREALKAVEWSDRHTDALGRAHCPVCRNAKAKGKHKPSCLIGNALKEVG